MPGTEDAHLKCTKVSESQLMGANADNKDHKYYVMNYVKFLATHWLEENYSHSHS